MGISGNTLSEARQGPPLPETRGRRYEGVPHGTTAGPHLVLVYDDGELIGPLAHQIVRHSPDGFSWGYGGSGPAELALNLILDATGREPPPSEYQAFKFAHVARWPQDGGWTMTRREIIDFLADAGARPE